MNKLLERQLRRAAETSATGQPDLENLCHLLDEYYESLDQERAQSQHAARLMSDELASLRNLDAESGNDDTVSLDDTPEALVIIDPQTRRIVDANRNACLLFGYARQRLLQLSYGELSPGTQPDGNASELGLLTFLARTMSGEDPTFVWQCRNANGCEFPTEIAQTRDRNSALTLIRVRIRDLSARHRREQRLGRSAEFERLLKALCTRFIAADAVGLDDAIVSALHRVCEFTGTDQGSLYQFTTNPADRADLVERTHDWRADAAAQTAAPRLLLDTELPWFAAQIRQMAPFQLGDLDRLPNEALRERSWCEQTGMTSFAVIPLTAHKQVVGFMQFQSRRAGLIWSREVLDRLRLVGDICVSALQRAHAAEQQGRLMAVLEATPSLVAMSDRSGALLYLNHSGRQQLGIAPDAELTRQSLSAYCVGDDASGVVDQGMQCAVRDGAWHGTLTLRAASGHELTVSQVTIAHRHEHGSVEYFSTIAHDISRQQQATLCIADNEKRLRLALESAGLGTWVWDIETGRLSWSGHVSEMFELGASAGDASLDSYLAIVHDEDRLAVEKTISGVLTKGIDHLEVNHRIVLASGRTYWIELNARINPDDDRPYRMVGTIADVTARKEAELSLFEEKERAQVTLQSIGDAVITTDQKGRVRQVNPIAAQRLHLTTEAAAGRLISELFCIISDKDGNAIDNPVIQCLRAGRTVAAKVGTILRTDRGEEFPIQFSAAPIRSHSGDLIGTVMIFHDASQERSLYQRMSYQAAHDALTGLINRREFENRLSQALQGVWQNEQTEHCLLYLDVDQFKVINDTCGHSAGDELLKRLTTVLRAEVRAADCLARLGGDEFCIILVDCPQKRAHVVAENLRRAVNQFRFVWQHHTFSVSVSIGLVRINAEVESLDSVLSAADVACFAAKNAGRNRVSTYRAAAALSQHREMQWVSRITQACEDDRLSLYYHPIIGMRNAPAQRHYELLLRMRDPYGQLIPPNAFIPAAERYSVMPVVDRWVVQHALKNFVQLDVADPADAYTLSINLSGSSLSDPYFLEMLSEELDSYKLVPGAVCFEITETAAITNLERVIHFMHEIRKTGCWFSLDDFGSGLSSFAYLKDLPVDFLKIDRHFVRNTAKNVVDHSMMAAINQVGHVMGLKTVAEGVESQAVLDKVRAAGIDYAQGFLFGLPQLATGRADFERRETAKIIQFA